MISVFCIVIVIDIDIDISVLILRVHDTSVALRATNSLNSTWSYYDTRCVTQCNRFWKFPRLHLLPRLAYFNSLHLRGRFLAKSHIKTKGFPFNHENAPAFELSISVLYTPTYLAMRFLAYITIASILAIASARITGNTIRTLEQCTQHVSSPIHGVSCQKLPSVLPPSHLFLDADCIY